MIVPFNQLIGKTLTSVTGLEEGYASVKFTCDDGSVFDMRHDDDCCESVELIDICGDPSDLIGATIVDAEEVSSSSNMPFFSQADAAGYVINHGPINDDMSSYDSYTWTFYRLQTTKGSLVLRWFGQSNGYYSEEVTVHYYLPGEYNEQDD